MTTPTSRWRAALIIHLLTDDQRNSTVAGIEKLAPQGPLIQLPTIAASFAALQAKSAVFATALENAAATEKVWRAAVGAADDARLTLDLELRTFKTLVENNAASPTDISGMGLVLASLARASRTPPDPPVGLIVKGGRTRGKATVAVDAKGYQGRFAAEVSANGTDWSVLPGTGKQRRISGYPSGTQLWVRFAAVRFGMQSAWCTPVHLTVA